MVNRAIEAGRNVEVNHDCLLTYSYLTMQFILSVARCHITIDTEAVTAGDEGRRRLRRWSTEHYSVYNSCLLVPIRTLKDRSANETWGALAFLVIHRQMEFAFKLAIQFIFGVFCGISYFKSAIFRNLFMFGSPKHQLRKTWIICYSWPVSVVSGAKMW